MIVFISRQFFFNLTMLFRLSRAFQKTAGYPLGKSISLKPYLKSQFEIGVLHKSMESIERKAGKGTMLPMVLEIKKQNAMHKKIRQAHIWVKHLSCALEA